MDFVFEKVFAASYKIHARFVLLQQQQRQITIIRVVIREIVLQNSGNTSQSISRKIKQFL